MSDEKTATVATTTGKATDTKAVVPARSLTRNQIICHVLVLSVTLFAVTIAALSTPWSTASLTMQTQGSPSTSLTFQLRVQSVVVGQSSSNGTATTSFSYTALTLPETQQIMLACRGFTIVVLVASLLLTLLALVTLHQDAKEYVVRSHIMQDLYSRLPIVLVGLSVFFSVAAVVVHIGIMRTMYRDDILRQITDGKLSCVYASGAKTIFNCQSFWTDTTTSVSSTEKILDNHHPYTGFWLMAAAFFVSLYLFVIVRRSRVVVSMHEEFTLARRQSEEDRKLHDSTATV